MPLWRQKWNDLLSSLIPADALETPEMLYRHHEESPRSYPILQLQRLRQTVDFALLPEEDAPRAAANLIHPWYLRNEHTIFMR